MEAERRSNEVEDTMKAKVYALSFNGHRVTE